MNKIQPPPGSMSVSTTARQLGRSVSTIYRWATKGGRLEEVRVGRRRFFRLHNTAVISKANNLSADAIPSDEPIPVSDVPAAKAIASATASFSAQIAAASGLQSSGEGQRGLQFRWPW